MLAPPYQQAPRPRLQRPVGPRGYRVFEFVVKNFADTRLASTLPDIQSACGISSSSAALYTIKLLERRGVVERLPGAARTILPVARAALPPVYPAIEIIKATEAVCRRYVSSGDPELRAICSWMCWRFTSDSLTDIGRALASSATSVSRDAWNLESMQGSGRDWLDEIATSILNYLSKQGQPS